MKIFLTIFIILPIFAFCQIQEFDTNYYEVQNIYSISQKDSSLIESNYIDSLGRVVKKVLFPKNQTHIYHYTNDKEEHYFYDSDRLITHSETKYSPFKQENIEWFHDDLEYQRIIECKDKKCNSKLKDYLYDYIDDGLSLSWLYEYKYDIYNNLISYFDSTISKNGFRYYYDNSKNGTSIKTTEVYNNLVLTGKQFEYKKDDIVILLTLDFKENKNFKTVEYFNDSNKIIKMEEYELNNSGKIDFKNPENIKGKLLRIKIYKYNSL